MKSLFRIVIGVAVACMVVVAATAQSHAGHEDHDTSTDDDMGVKIVTGEVIDIACYVRHDATGPKDVKCALNCAELGMPLGILEEGTETIYLIIPAGHGAPKEAVVGFIGQHVTAKLMIFRNGGLNSAEVMSIAAASQPATVD
ncbi:MAG TPA: hypothetical protein EYQ31_04360 [Candidatus Handelsmanbacteria bacterium]|nr:hypothetical protein [Candidatus Handelsmanbacteria bacterium]